MAFVKGFHSWVNMPTPRSATFTPLSDFGLCEVVIINPVTYPVFNDLRAVRTTTMNIVDDKINPLY